MDLTIPENWLYPVGDEVDAHPDAWLSGVLTINGVDHHFEAIAVVDDGTEQRAEARALSDQLDLIATATAIDGSFMTVRIGMRDYVLSVTPLPERPIHGKSVRPWMETLLRAWRLWKGTTQAVTESS